MAITPRVQLLLTGNELMSGDTLDSNSSMVARQLAELGLTVARKVTVGDDLNLLIAEMKAMAASADILLVNGGLGPTIDDLTAVALGRVAGRPLVEHPAALEHLQQWCEHRGIALDAANRKQAQLPEACDILPNLRGSAVGFALNIGGCRIYCTPGVPGELATMLEPVCADITSRWTDLARRDVLRLQTFGIGESAAQQLIADALRDWPPDVELGFRAGAPQLEIKLAIGDPAAEAARDGCRKCLNDLFGDHIIGEGDSTMASSLLDLLIARDLRIATAESCTGGLIAAMLTRVPGSSAAFEAGFVTYSNAMKSALLGVSETTLKTHGAVSEAVVREMTAGALARSGADLAVAVSGVAGPAGGSEDKPVGTVWIAWGGGATIDAVCLHWPVERALFQTMVAATALDLLRRRVLDLPRLPRYGVQRQVSPS